MHLMCTKHLVHFTTTLKNYFSLWIFFFNYGQYGKSRFMLAVHEKIIGGGSRCIWKTTCKWPEGTPMKVLEDKLRAKANKHGYFETTYWTLH